MNSGKSLALLTKDYMMRENGKTTMLIKPSVDTRSTKISSRLGIERDCVTVTPDENIFNRVRKYCKEEMDGIVDYVLVDEAQFLTKEQVWQLSDLVDDVGIEILCYGIKLSWQGDFFEGSKELMKISDELIQMDSMCSETSNPALFHVKKGGSDAAVETGFEDMYDTVSRSVWKEIYTK